MMIINTNNKVEVFFNKTHTKTCGEKKVQYLKNNYNGERLSINLTFGLKYLTPSFSIAG